MSTREVSGSDCFPRRRVIRITLTCAFLAAAMSAALVAQTPPQAVVAGRNVNMVSGTTWPTGDPFLQRQNEPSVAVSTRNPLHMLAGANDYRTVDMPGLLNDTETGDAWLGVFKSFDGGQRWQSTLVQGYPLDYPASTLTGYSAGADPVVRAGAHGLFYYSGLVFDRGSTGKSAVFVSRFIDNNNLETGDPIGFAGTTIVAKDPGTTGRFLDKPWIAVDIPRGTASTCRIVTQPPPVPPGMTPVAPVTQTIPASPAYLAYTVLTNRNGVLSAEIRFTRSMDCGSTWSPPIVVSRPQDALNQGATIAINPLNGEVYVAWRRLSAPGSTDSDAFLVARSTDQGRKFSNPGVARRFPRGKKKGLSLERYFEHQRLTEANEASDVAEFDQGTSEYWLSFRTNAYPSMTFDGEGRLYLAWSERGFAQQQPSDVDGDARIVMTTTLDGAVFTAPHAIDESGQFGHQIMPTLTFAGGRLLLVYYDLREDVSGLFGPYIDDRNAIAYVRRRRHTIDVRATTATPAETPLFAPSTRVSEYARGTQPNEIGPPRQLQFNPPNLPLFKLGTVPFMGDYIDVAPAPAFVLGADGRWQYNIAAGAAPVFHGVWTDNRDVKPPAQRGTDDMPDWSKYTKPGDAAYNVCEAGTRNQNIYTARMTTGLIAGSPGNTKPLTMAFPRSFVVFAQNTTEDLKFFRFTIANQPAGGRASFLEYPLPPYNENSAGPTTQVDVAVPRRSVVARTVYATAPDPKARIVVNVEEIAAVEAPAPLENGLKSAVVLNPDISNPDISNPDISNPDISNPDISNAEVHNPDISNPDISNPDISNPDISNPDISNPDISNPDISNPDISNPDISNPDISNPDISNPDISNPDISNPDISNPDISNGSITDVTWTITNHGNTTTAFDVKLFFTTLTEVPDGIKLQLILYRVYKTPVAEGCALKEQTHNVLVSNIPNPDISNPDISNTPLRTTAMRNAAAAGDEKIEEARKPTIWIEPEGVAKMTLRIVDEDRTDEKKLDPTEITPEVKAEAKNTEDLDDPSKEPPSAKPAPAPDVPLLTFTGQPVTTPMGEIMPEVVVKVTLGDAGVAGVPVALSFADNPSGAELLGTTIRTSDADGFARFDDLSLTKDGSGFRLAASAGSTDAVPVISAAFESQGTSTVVTNRNDSGSGSLRQAILNANAHAGVDVISFAIPGTGPFTIAPLSALPRITDPATIDGTTQPGYPGTPIVELDGAAAGAVVHGLEIQAGGSTVRGLAINRFSAAGILLAGAGGNVVAGNYVGIDVTGAVARGNGNGGIAVTSAGNLIGPSDGVPGNVIAGNTNAGVLFITSAAANNAVRGNFIGVNAAGTGAVPNQRGVSVVDAIGTTIGGDTPGERNVISGNTQYGIQVAGASATTIIKGNYVGTSASGAAAVANGSYGIVLLPAQVTGAQILNNVISGNAGNGMQIQTGAAAIPAPIVRGNLIGTDATGAFAIGNQYGILVSSSPNVTIGGTNEADRNVISGNRSHGLALGVGSNNTNVQGNYVGLNAAGSSAVPNGTTPGTVGIMVYSSSNTIGEAAPGGGNVVSGNTGNGILLQSGANGNTIEGNHVGLDAGGALAVPNGSAGIAVIGSGNTIGGTTTAARNVVSGNLGIGIRIEGATATGNFVQGNYVGLDRTGNSAVPNGSDGVATTAFASGNTIGGDVAGAGNVISGNARRGVTITTSNNNFVQGNLIGLNAAGMAAVPNGTIGSPQLGLSVSFGSNNTIGGATEGARNVVSGNSGGGINIDSGAGNVLQGNYVGLAVDGDTAIPNGGDGLYVGTGGNTVGGSSPGEGNVIAGNIGTGMQVNGTTLPGTVVEGNYVGTNATGTAARPNSVYGIMVTGLDVRVERNLVSGNTRAGVALYWAKDGIVVGNLIGTDKTGAIAIGNGIGVWITYGATNCTVGGTDSASRNVISGNGTGVVFSGGSPATTGNTVLGNYIGVAKDGVSPRPNTAGVVFDTFGSLQNNTVGGTATGAGNLIANNTSQQVSVLGGTGSRILSNWIIPPAGSAQIGIDLGNTGAAPNDTGDADSGPNGLQNYPELAWADNSITAGQTTVQLSFNSTAAGTFTLQFFANAACAPSARPAENPIATTDAFTGPDGNVTQTTFTLPLVPVGSFVTATATGPDGTSEVSACVPVIDGGPLNLTVLNTNDSGPGSFRQTIQAANSHPGEDTILFDIPGVPPFTIPLSGGLPSINEPVVINGASQPGYVDKPVVEIDGNFAGGSTVGLDIVGGGTTVRGLAINRFGGGAIKLSAAGGNKIAGNYIGIGLDGMTGRGSGGGIEVTSAVNLIGGPAAADRNVISGNTGGGIHIWGGAATGNRVHGNYIGVAANGEAARPNTVGVLLDNGAAGNMIGGTTTAARNVISSNLQAAIAISASGGSNDVEGNYIGLNAAGTAALPNNCEFPYDAAVYMATSSDHVGGEVEGAGNVISGNNCRAILISGGGTNLVQGNVIGLDPTGAVAIGNRSNGVTVSNSSGNVIGGLLPGARNVISGNAGQGIAVTLAGSAGNAVQGNYVGTNALGTAAVPNTLNGVSVSAAVDTRVEKNLLSGNSDSGVRVTSGATGTVVSGNLIGTNAAGTGPLPNNYGVYVETNASGTIVGGADRNVISGNTYAGVTIEGAQNNQVMNNHIGTDQAGAASLGGHGYGVVLRNTRLATVSGNLISGHNAPGYSGVFITSSGGLFSSENVVASNRIGTNAIGNAAVANEKGVLIADGSFSNRVAGNLISGNGDAGVVLLSGAHHNAIHANRIGSGEDGTAAVPNRIGVSVLDAPNNTIGTSSIDDRNLISGNLDIGVLIRDPNSLNTILEGNHIGVVAGGASALPNGLGVYLANTSNIKVDYNVVSGNIHNGVEFASDVTASRVYYNRIGTNPASTTAVPNAWNGVMLWGAATSGNEVHGNVISGNGWSGVEIAGSASSNLVQFNMIGRGTDGLISIPNGLQGVNVSSGTNNTIGSTSSLGQNSIGYNLGDGVRIDPAATGNPVLGNGIFSNGGLGINRQGGGPAAPVLTSAVTYAAPVHTDIVGSVNLGAPDVTLRVEFFRNVACDGSGSGEGEAYLGYVTTTTDVGGVGNFTATFPFTIAIGQVITATTVTNVSGGETSAFSVCRPVTGG